MYGGKKHYSKLIRSNTKDLEKAIPLKVKVEGPIVRKKRHQENKERLVKFPLETPR